MTETDKTEDEKPTRGRRRKTDGDLCSQCWPNGWPEDANTAVCDHGSYQR